jgi:glutamyl-tRNA reductase
MTCGMHSQIFGEDQILTQVGEALRSARDHDQTDPVLETLFRTALTAAKRVKTEAPLHQRDHSVPERAITILENTYGALRGKSCLVIGNGEMGRLLCHLLRERGAVVHLTTRRYRHHDTIVPEGCTAVSYDDRYHWIAASDFVFSATISPHCTVKSSLLLPRRISTPLVLVDLAVPRDMEPELAELPGITLYNMDTLNLEQHCDEESLALARAILQESEDDFYRWQTTRNDVVSIRGLGRG